MDTARTPSGKLRPLTPQRILSHPYLRRLISFVVGISVLGIGVTGIVAWSTGNQAMIQISPTFPVLHYLSSLAFILTGAAFFFSAVNLHRMSGWVGVAVTAIGVAALLGSIAGRSEGARILLTGLGLDPQSVAAVHVAPNTALSVIASGLAFAASGWRGRRRLALPLSIVGALVFALGAVAAIGYFTGVAPAYGWTGFYGMSPYAACALCLIGIGIQDVVAQGFVDSDGLLAERWLAVPVFAAMEVATISLAIAVSAQGHTMIERQIEATAAGLQVSLAEKVDADFKAISRMARRWADADASEEKKWEDDANAYMSEITGIVSMAWIDRDLLARWIVPAAAKTAALGLFVGLEPIRRETIEAAKRARAPRITPTVDLFMGGPGVVVFAPSFVGEDFRGLIGAAYRPADLFAVVAGKTLRGDFSARVADHDRIIFRHTVDDSANDAEWGKDVVVELPGLAWTVRVWPSAAFLASARNSLPEQVVVGGTLLALLCAALVISGQRAYRRQRIIEKTAEALRNNVAELVIARKAADAANAAKTAFLSNITHELRTPLGVIIGYIDLADRTKEIKGVCAEYLKVIKRNSATLLGLINDLLDLSKVESGHLFCERATTPLREVLTDVLTTFQHAANEKGVELIGRFETSVPRTVETDRQRLRQILVNLVGNALKFTAKGYVGLHVRLVPSGAGALIEMLVADTGIGIAADHHASIFEPFTQADASIARQFGGTGLGLGLSRRLARALGGDVVLARSEPGHGSTFIATIDPGRLDMTETLPPGEIAEARSIASSAEALHHKGTARVALRGAKILLVDDSPDMRLLVQKILECSGATVDTAQDGREGVTTALAGAYDLILMDVQMAALSGVEAVQELRASGYSKPILALTANALPGDRDRGLALGFTEYLCKPVSAGNLLAVIRRLLTQSMAEDREPTGPAGKDGASTHPLDRADRPVLLH